jgi:hypothetical protein
MAFLTDFTETALKLISGGHRLSDILTETDSVVISQASLSFKESRLK